VFKMTGGGIYFKVFKDYTENKFKVWLVVHNYFSGVS